MDLKGKSPKLLKGSVDTIVAKFDYYLGDAIREIPCINAVPKGDNIKSKAAHPKIVDDLRRKAIPVSSVKQTRDGIKLQLSSADQQRSATRYLTDKKYEYQQQEDKLPKVVVRGIGGASIATDASERAGAGSLCTRLQEVDRLLNASNVIESICYPLSVILHSRRHIPTIGLFAFFVHRRKK